MKESIRTMKIVFTDFFPNPGSIFSENRWVLKNTAPPPQNTQFTPLFERDFRWILLGEGKKGKDDSLKIRNWMIFGITSGVVLILQGCMLMHFMDDHHSGMMGHGKESHEGKKEGEHQSAVLLDRNLRTDSRGGIIVEIQFRELTEKGELAFTVRMNDHVPGTNEYALDNLAILANDQGIQVQASRWQSITLSAQRVSGTLYFPAKDDSGKPLLGHGVHNMTLTIKGLAGIRERVFRWNVASGH